LRDQLGQAAKATIAQDFSVGQMIDRHVAMYEEILHGG